MAWPPRSSGVYLAESLARANRCVFKVIRTNLKIALQRYRFHPPGEEKTFLPFLRLSCTRQPTRSATPSTAEENERRQSTRTKLDPGILVKRSNYRARLEYKQGDTRQPIRKTDRLLSDPGFASAASSLLSFIHPLGHSLKASPHPLAAKIRAIEYPHTTKNNRIDWMLLLAIKSENDLP